MGPGDGAGFRHAFVLILTAGLLAMQVLFVWFLVIAAIWYVATDFEIFIDPDEVQSFPMQVAEIVVPVAMVISSLVIAPWIAWTYVRSGPHRPSRKQRMGAGFLVVTNIAWMIWIGLEIAFWPPDFFDIASMAFAGIIAVLVTALSFSRQPVGLSPG